MSNKSKSAINAMWDAYGESRVAFGKQLCTIIAAHGRWQQWSDIKVLDVGCGHGQIANAFAKAGADVWAVEISIERVEAMKLEASKNPVANPVKLMVGDAHNLPFPAESFDVVILSDVLEHVQVPSTVLGEVKRVLRQGGLLYASTTNRFSIVNFFTDPHYSVPAVGIMPRPVAAWYITKLLRISEHYTVEKYFSRQQLIRLFRRIGLECEELRGRYEAKIRSGDMARAPGRTWIINLLQRNWIKQYALWLTRGKFFNYFVQPGWEFLAFKPREGATS